MSALRRRYRLGNANVEMRKESGYWSLYVNGVRYVDRESYQVAANIMEELRHPHIAGHSECAEVADTIRRRLQEGTQ